MEEYDIEEPRLIRVKPKQAIGIRLRNPMTPNTFCLRELSGMIRKRRPPRETKFCIAGALQRRERAVGPPTVRSGHPS